MRINTNIASMNAQQISNNTNKEIGNSLEKLSSGHAINKASDDAAGLAIADNLRTQATSLNQAVKNANSGVAMIQMADKALDEVSNILDTIKGKAVQAANGDTSTTGLANIKADIKALLDNVTDIFQDTKYNDTALLNRSAGAALKFQTGELSGQDVSVAGSGLTSVSALGLSSGAALASAADATALMTLVDTALDTLNTKRADLGSGQLKLESSVRSNQVAVVSLQNAESVIRDTDYAAESANFNKLNIISQAGMYAVSQANSSQQNVMKLLQ